MLLKTDLLDPSGEGGCVRFAHHLNPRESDRDSARRYWDQPGDLSRRLSQWRPLLQARHCKAETSAGAGDGCPNLTTPKYLVNFWALG